jgi:hypothetical protein
MTFSRSHISGFLFLFFDCESTRLILANRVKLLDPILKHSNEYFWTDFAENPNDLTRQPLPVRDVDALVFLSDIKGARNRSELGLD